MIEALEVVMVAVIVVEVWSIAKRVALKVQNWGAKHE